MNQFRRQSPDSPGCIVADLARLVADGEQFGTIYADPPWQYGNQATRAATDNHYPTMTVDEICALPIKQLAAEDCHLHLWTTNAFLPDSFRVVDAWGFTYKSVFVWCKPQMGIGNYWRVSTEFLVLGTRGESLPWDESLLSWAVMGRGRHSAKPEQARLWIERTSPGPRLELFGRQALRNWTVFGDDVSRDLFTQDAERR